ncbi:hypothetical protein BB558_003818 [Smittium angustum]|uniref:RING-type domain-containing protein n=1 Tax=Smittium angustum TaxID=133377 RepID=A0A2U1J4Y2_SMIAN|nr:hypothetical protein BB558_003818 [Smittium angustum]
MNKKSSKTRKADNLNDSTIEETSSSRQTSTNSTRNQRQTSTTRSKRPNVTVNLENNNLSEILNQFTYSASNSRINNQDSGLIPRTRTGSTISSSINVNSNSPSRPRYRRNYPIGTIRIVDNPSNNQNNSSNRNSNLQSNERQNLNTERISNISTRTRANQSNSTHSSRTSVVLRDNSTPFFRTSQRTIQRAQNNRLGAYIPRNPVSSGSLRQRINFMALVPHREMAPIDLGQRYTRYVDISRPEASSNSVNSELGSRSSINGNRRGIRTIGLSNITIPITPVRLRRRLETNHNPVSIIGISDIDQTRQGHTDSASDMFDSQENESYGSTQISSSDSDSNPYSSSDFNYSGYNFSDNEYGNMSNDSQQNDYIHSRIYERDYYPGFIGSTGNDLEDFSYLLFLHDQDNQHSPIRNKTVKKRKVTAKEQKVDKMGTHSRDVPIQNSEEYYEDQENVCSNSTDNLEMVCNLCEGPFMAISNIFASPCGHPICSNCLDNQHAQTFNCPSSKPQLNIVNPEQDKHEVKLHYSLNNPKTIEPQH